MAGDPDPDPAAAGAVVVVGLPEGCAVGLDLLRYAAGPRFRGFAQVPAGVHLLHAGLGDLRHGEWIELRAGQVAVREWDPATEELRPGREAAEDVAGRPLDVASGFGPYDAARNAPWGRLAGRVSAAVLARCRANAGVLFPAQEEVSEVPVRVVEAAPAPDGGAAAEQAARYTPLHLRRRAGMSPGEVTQYNLDGAVRLETVLAASFEGDWKLLLGELQAAFLLFLQISCFASLKQWMHLVELLCRADGSVDTRRALYAEFLGTLKAQLGLVDQDFFEDAVCEGSFLGPALEHLLGALEGADDRAPGPDFAPLAAPREALKRLVAERFGFRAADFSCPNEEDAPTVVAEPAEPGAGAAEPAPKDAAPVGPDVGRMGWMLSPPE